MWAGKSSEADSSHSWSPCLQQAEAPLSKNKENPDSAVLQNNDFVYLAGMMRRNGGSDFTNLANSPTTKRKGTMTRGRYGAKSFFLDEKIFGEGSSDQ